MDVYVKYMGQRMLAASSTISILRLKGTCVQIFDNPGLPIRKSHSPKGNTSRCTPQAPPSKLIQKRATLSQVAQLELVVYPPQSRGR